MLYCNFRAYKCRMKMHLERVSVCNSVNKLSNQVERALRGCYHINVNKTYSTYRWPEVRALQRTYFRLCAPMVSIVSYCCPVRFVVYGTHYTRACLLSTCSSFLLSIRRCDECNHNKYLRAQNVCVHKNRRAKKKC